MAKALPKTNVMRLLEAEGLPYTAHEYPHTSGPVAGPEVARLLGVSHDMVFKTLVTAGSGGGHYVFVVPVEAELDLKKAARAAGEKSIHMIRQAELVPLTGYEHGGCSPLGMKKRFPTVFAEEVILIQEIIVSAGKVGFQVQLAVDRLIALTGGEVADITAP